MNPSEADAHSPWADAVRAAAIFAVDPVGTGGVVLRSPPGPVRDAWLALLRRALPTAAPWRRVPLHVADGRLLGGLDLAATLGGGRPVAERGLLAEADGGVVLLAMAERLEASTAARLAVVLDAGEIALERDGLARRFSTRFGVVALDEGIAADERVPAALRERLAFQFDLGAIGAGDANDSSLAPEHVAAARARLAGIEASVEVVEALCSAAALLGIASLRAPLLALRAARAASALWGETAVSERAVALAARLVLPPRALTLPSDASSSEHADPRDEAASEPRLDETSAADELQGETTTRDVPLSDLVLAAATAALPDGLLTELRLAEGARARARSFGKAGARRVSMQRGRPTGVRRGEPRRGARLNVIETLRAAAPWQRLRRAASGCERVQVRSEDFRVNRFKQRSEVTTIFVVDASGSTALQRLAEAKGAVELLLAECYVRRDRVALIAFRGRAAETLLPPTRSLVRAKQSLARLPGGGGTPLAAGIETALLVANAVQRAGSTPLLVFLTDGRANVARDGTPGRARAEQDALAASRLVRDARVAALLVDTSPRPQASAQQLAQAMAARYTALPHADSAALRESVRDAGAELMRFVAGSR